MSQIKLVHSGGNGVIISAPSSNPAANRTITLPGNADGEMLTTTNPKTGNIIQVVQTVKTSKFSSTSEDSWVAITGLAATITPSSTSNKIIIHVNIGCQSSFQNDYGLFYRIYRGGSNLTSIIGDADGNKTRCFVASRNSHNSRYQPVVMKYLDSPNTTSAITYQVYCLLEDSGGAMIINSSGQYLNNDNDIPAGASTITLEEVAG